MCAFLAHERTSAYERNRRASCVHSHTLFVCFCIYASACDANARIRMRCVRIRIRIACTRMQCECAHLRETHVCLVLYWESYISEQLFNTWISIQNNVQWTNTDIEKKKTFCECHGGVNSTPSFLSLPLYQHLCLGQRCNHIALC